MRGNYFSSDVVNESDSRMKKSIYWLKFIFKTFKKKIYLGCNNRVKYIDQFNLFWKLVM